MARKDLYTTAALIALLAGCSQLPGRDQGQGGQFIESGPGEFAVFADGRAAVAIRMGAKNMIDQNTHALHAIEQATGCKAVAQSVFSDGKSIQADIICTPLHLPTAPLTRGSQI